MAELPTLILTLRPYKAVLFSEVLCLFLKPLKACKYFPAYTDLRYCPVLCFISIVTFIFTCTVEAVIAVNSAVICPFNRFFIKDVGGTAVQRALQRRQLYYLKGCSKGISPWQVQKRSVCLCGCSKVLPNSFLTPKRQWSLNCSLGAQSAELFLKQWQPVNNCSITVENGKFYLSAYCSVYTCRDHLSALRGSAS